MSLLEADQLANPEPFVPHRYVIELVETGVGDWYVNITHLKGEYAEGGDFINRWSYGQEELPNVVAEHVRDFLRGFDK